MLVCHTTWTEETEMRELREENERLMNEARKSTVQFKEASEGFLYEEEKWRWTARRIWMKEKKDCKQFRKIDEFTDLPQDFVVDLAKNYRTLSKGETTSCREHQQMQSLSQKLQSLRKTRNSKVKGLCIDGQREMNSSR